MYSVERAVTPAAVSEYWANQPTDDPFSVNEFLLEYFRKRLGEPRKNHIKAIPLEEINEVMNDVWDGPGSVIKLVNLTYELRAERFKDAPADVKNTLKGYEVPTYESDIGKSAVDKIEK